MILRLKNELEMVKKLLQYGGMLSILLYSSSLVAQSAASIVDKMSDALENTSKMTYDIYLKERFGSTYVEKEMHFRVNENPRKVYAKNLEDGVEILYVTGWNNDKAYINPNGFPWVNVSFDIYNDRMTKEAHHLISDAGFELSSSMITNFRNRIEQEGKNFDDHFSYKGETTWDGKSCYKIYMDDPNYGYTTYTVTRDETLHQLANRLGVPAHKIQEKNGGKLPYQKSLKGRSLTVPTSYAKQVIFFVDKTTYLPLVQMVYDDKGLYEKYEYRNLDISPSLYTNEWTDDCSSYGF